MAKLSRKGDANTAGGKIKLGAETVFANGIEVGLHTSEISAHGSNKHKNAKTTEGSATVFVENSAVLYVGAGNDCGHSIAEGSPDVFVG